MPPEDETTTAATPLTPSEKAYFDTIRQKAPVHRGLHLTRMTLDGKPVAVVLTEVFNRFSQKAEGMMPLAVIIDEDMAGRLREIDGKPGVSTSPYDLDPGR